jgi:hypothetical protein
MDDLLVERVRSAGRFVCKMLAAQEGFPVKDGDAARALGVKACVLRSRDELLVIWFNQDKPPGSRWRFLVRMVMRSRVGTPPSASSILQRSRSRVTAGHERSSGTRSCWVRSWGTGVKSRCPPTKRSNQRRALDLLSLSARESATQSDRVKSWPPSIHERVPCHVPTDLTVPPHESQS